MGSALGGAASFVLDPLDLMGTRAEAQAKGDMANTQLKEQQADRAAAMGYAQATPAELANMQRAIAFSEGDIARKTKLLESVDPALIEAGIQAKAMLQGKEAASLSPIRQNLARQESKLREKLAAQLGSGYETSTAGIQALERFNEQANMTMANAQQQSLGQLLGVAQNSRNMAGNLNTELSLGNLLGNIQNRKISALQNNRVDPGLGYAGQIAQAQGTRSLINTGLQVAGMAMGMGGGGMGGSGTGGGGVGQSGFDGGF